MISHWGFWAFILLFKNSFNALRNVHYAEGWLSSKRLDSSCAESGIASDWIVIACYCGIASEFYIYFSSYLCNINIMLHPIWFIHFKNNLVSRFFLKCWLIIYSTETWRIEADNITTADKSNVWRSRLLEVELTFYSNIKYVFNESNDFIQWMISITVFKVIVIISNIINN